MLKIVIMLILQKTMLLNLLQICRMIYVHRVRMEPDGVFGAFDCPDAGQPIAKRSRSTTAIQALALLNSTFVVQQAELFAARVQRESPPAGDVSQHIEHAFLLALGRDPTPSELAAAKQVAEEHGLAAVCRSLFNANEFLFMP